jgi:hypothetical protein
MKRSLFVALLVSGLAVGCKPKEAASNPPPEAQTPAEPNTASADSSSTAPSPGGAPVAMPPLGTPDTSPVPAAESGNISATLNALTLRVRSYVASTHKTPQTFEEYVAANPNMQIPPPPSGKKYSFDHKMKVILVDR